jgi:energy-converting hydrogenase Eha subunit A
LNTLEELEKRKKELELRRDIARLEKQERFIFSFDPAWLFAAPVIACVSFIAFVIIDNNGIKTLPSAILGIIVGVILSAVFRWIRKRQLTNRV